MEPERIAQIDGQLRALSEKRNYGWACVWIGVAFVFLGLSQGQILGAVAGFGITSVGWVWKASVEHRAQELGRERQRLVAEQRR